MLLPSILISFKPIMEASPFINSLPSFLQTPKPLNSSTTKTPIIYPRIHPRPQNLCCANRPKIYTNNDNFSSVSDEDSVQSDKSSNADWETVFIGENGPDAASRKKSPKSRLLLEDENTDWCVRARKVALKSIEARGLTEKFKSMVTTVKKTKIKKKKKKKKQPIIDELKSFSSGNDEDDLDFETDLNKTADLRRTVSMIGDGMFEERKEKSMEVLVQRLSEFSGPSDRRKEINLNKSIVEAQTAEEVLEVTADIIMEVSKGLSPSPLSPLNIATALHRIAKNMEKVSMLRSHRLAFARKREMSMLVGIAMSALPDCSAQGVSNIAWALSKIGGELLYLSEMDRVAEVALTKVSEFNSQNVANVAGAFAAMHHSAPELFSQLSVRASTITETFQPQEIAQVLWAFASLYEPADSLMESLDRVYKYEKQIECSGTRVLDAAAPSPHEFPMLRFVRDEVGNICWSYAVLGQLDRVFFSHIWRTLCHMDDSISDQYREDVMFATQVHLVKLSLMLEYPHLELSLPNDLENKLSVAGKTKKFNQKVTSSFQKEVLRLLVSTGLEWVKEYKMEEGGYTLDAALVQHKVALEIDGPTHFSRNSGVPLGHTMLKRRCIIAAGWKLISVQHQQWEELQGESQQIDYLRGLLADFTDKRSSKIE